MRKMKFFGVLLTLFLFIGTSIGLSAALGEVTITVTHNVSTVDESQTSLKATHGSLLSITAPAIKEEQVFKYWVVNGILRQDYAREQSIIVKASLDLKAVYGDPIKHTVTFIDSNGAYIKHGFVDDNGSAESLIPTKTPDKPQAKFAGWVALNSSIEIGSITGDVVFVATYTATGTAGSLTVDGVLQDPVNINVVVELDLPKGKTHWVDGEGNILSYEQTYKFTMLVEDRVVNSVADGTKQPIVNMVAEPNLRTEHTSYVGQFDSNGLDVIEYGFIISRSKDVLTLDSLGATIIPSNTYNQETNEFLRSFAEDSYNSIRAYAIFKDGATQVVKYSDNMIGGHESIFATDLFISEYIEGSSNNKAIEIYNGTGATVDLSNYSIKLFANGASTETNTLNLTGELAHGKTYVIVNSSANETLKNLSNIEYAVANFNGDDAIALAKNGINIDIFGVIGEQIKWGENVTLVRNNDVLSPKTTYDNTQWTIHPIDTTTYLGSHDMEGIFIASHEIVYDIESNKTIDFVNDGQTLLEVPLKLGHSFDGWFLDEELTIPFSGPVNQSLTLYAKFSIKSVTLTFDVDGGTPVTSITQNYGTAITPPATPTKEGYTFSGWSPELPSTMPADNQIYTAQWSVNQYTVTFNTDGGNTIEPQNINYGTVLELPTPIKAGFNFNGWNNLDGTPFTGTTMPANDLSLKADWVDASSTSVVSFNTNGGSNIDPIVVTNGQTVDQPANPTKDGFTFAGWFIDEGLETAYVFSNLVNSDIILFAKWENPKSISHTLVYTFTSKSWEADSSLDEGPSITDNWTSGKDGYGKADQGIQVTTGASGANGTSPIINNITSIEIIYATNASKGAGNIVTTIGETTIQTFNVTTSGGTTPRSAGIISDLDLSGAIKITVTCTTNSVYIHSIKITYNSNPA